MGVMKGGGGGGQSPIPTQPTHPMEPAKSDVGDVVEGGDFTVGVDDRQVIPPLSIGGLPLKGRRRMAPLRFISTEVMVQGDHIHAPGGVDKDSGGVDGANPRFQLAQTVHRHDPRKQSTVLGAGIRRTALNSGRASPSCCHECVPRRFLRRGRARSGSLMSKWMRVGEGCQPVAQSTTSHTSRPPVYVASSSVSKQPGRARKGVWVSAAGSGCLPCYDRAIVREIAAAHGDQSVERCST